LTILLTRVSKKIRREYHEINRLRSIHNRKTPSIHPCEASVPEIAVSLPAMANVDDFNDRQDQIDAENEPYHQYEYQTAENQSWAGALPVKQYVMPTL
jgi:hypothetical protein